MHSHTHTRTHTHSHTHTHTHTHTHSHTHSLTHTHTLTHTLTLTLTLTLTHTHTHTGVRAVQLEQQAAHAITRLQILQVPRAQDSRVAWASAYWPYPPYDDGPSTGYVPTHTL